MSVAAKKGVNVKAETIRCAARFWKLFPHLLLCLSLVAYAAFGALMFQHIEGQSKPDKTDFHDFLGEIVSTVQNSTCKCPHIPGSLQHNFMNHVYYLKGSQLSDICVGLDLISYPVGKTIGP